MVEISHLKVCKNCSNVYSEHYGGTTKHPAICPVCKLEDTERVSVD